MGTGPIFLFSRKKGEGYFSRWATPLKNGACPHFLFLSPLLRKRVHKYERF